MQYLLSALPPLLPLLLLHCHLGLHLHPIAGVGEEGFGRREGFEIEGFDLKLPVTSAGEWILEEVDFELGETLEGLQHLDL